MRRDWLLFGILVLGGMLAANLHVRIPGTPIFFEFRWAFGFLGIGLIRRTWLAFVLVVVLSGSLLGGQLVWWQAFCGNLLYMLPVFGLLRWATCRWLPRFTHPLRYGVVWAVLAAGCYELIMGPFIWIVSAWLAGDPLLSTVVAGWGTPALHIEAAMVTVLTTLGMVAARFHHSLAQAVAGLERSQRLLETTGRVARVGGWEMASPTGAVIWTREIYRIHELPPGRMPSLDEALSFWHGDDRPILVESLRRAWEHGEPYDLELRFITATGRHLHARTRCEPQLRDGRVVKLTGTLQDITDRKQVQLQLEAIFNLSLALICTADPVSGSFTRINPAFSDVLGYNEEELLGTSFLALIHPDDVEATRAQMEERLAHGQPVLAFENRYRHKDGSYRRLSWFANPAADDGLVYAVAIDVTERDVLQEQIRQMEKMDAIGQLAGGIAHDFNNQLAGIQGYAELLARDLTEPRQRARLDAIATATRRSADLTSKLLAFSRRARRSTAVVDLHAIVGEALALVERSIDRRIVIQTALDAEPATTLGDAAQLDSAVLNLCLNARDAMPAGGTLRIATTIVAPDAERCRVLGLPETGGAYVALSVSDTGCGMAPTVRKHIFEPFFTTKEVGKGTGMGLAAVFGTVQQHGGAIAVDSTEGVGSCFSLYLPSCHACVLPAEEAVVAADALTGLRILVAEDESALRELSRSVLCSAGAAVHLAADGEQAVACYGEHADAIDVVVLDMVMPRMDGAAALRAIRAQDPDAAIVLVSGYSAENTIEDLATTGIRFLQKPYTVADLVAAIAAAHGAGSRSDSRG